MKTEGTINWLDSCIVCDGRQERRKEGMPPGMSESVEMGFQREQSGLDRTEAIQESKGHEVSRGGGDGGKIERVEDLFTDDW